MGILTEYINRKLSIPELEVELVRLITEYNKLQNTYLLVYGAASNKAIPSVPLEQADFYFFRDLLSGKNFKKVDIYLETPGGRGETAEDIVRFLRKKFDTVNFVIAGEAKSAGTILALSGNDILMTETGSLGPIDAQVKIGRSIVSACDYIEWISKKRKEAKKNSKLNPFDATVVAQITPGEFNSVFHALEFAKDLVRKWIPKYKFATWTETETRKIPVTDKMKRTRANEIARDLTDRKKWHLHGKSIKAEDLESIGLKIKKIDDDPKLADIVYRIQAVCLFLFDTNIFKIFATQDDKIFRLAVPTTVGGPLLMPALPPGVRPGPPSPAQAEAVQLEVKCSKCGNVHKIYAKFSLNPQIDADMKNMGFIPFPKESKIKCMCGFEIDLLGIKNQIEVNTKRKIIQNDTNN